MNEVGRWTGMNLVEKGNLKMSLHSTLCKTENMTVNHNKENEGGAGGVLGMTEASPAPWESSLALRQE